LFGFVYLEGELYKRTCLPLNLVNNHTTLSIDYLAICFKNELARHNIISVGIDYYHYDKNWRFALLHITSATELFFLNYVFIQFSTIFHYSCQHQNLI
jgi:hypothetical protein